MLLRSDFRSQTANQAGRTRRDYRNGLNWFGRFNRDSNSAETAGAAGQPAAIVIRDTFRDSEKRSSESRLAPRHFWCGHRCRPWIFHASIARRPSPSLLPATRSGPSWSRSLSDGISLLRNPGESTHRDISQQNLSIARVTYSERLFSATTVAVTHQWTQTSPILPIRFLFFPTPDLPMDPRWHGFRREPCRQRSVVRVNSFGTWWTLMMVRTPRSGILLF